MLEKRIVLNQNFRKGLQKTCKAPPISFSYGSMIGESQVKPVFTRIEAPIPLAEMNRKKSPLVPNKVLKEICFIGTYQPKTLKVSKRRRIFKLNSNSIDQKPAEKELSNDSNLADSCKRKQKIMSMTHHSGFQDRRKRNSIFEEYHPKTNYLVKTQPTDEIKNHLFPIHRSDRPKSMVHYVSDLKQGQKQQDIYLRKTYVSQYLRQEERENQLDRLKIFQTASQAVSNLPKESQVVQFELDQSIKQNSNRQRNNSFTKANFDDILASAPRFFDKEGREEIPPIPISNNYIDVNLKSTSSSGWGKIAESLGVNKQKSSFMFKQEMEKLFSRLLGNKNILPYLLIILGVLLLLIQLIK